MSTQITLPSAGGGTLLEGPRYKYLYADGTPSENGRKLIEAYEAAQYDDVIVLGPGDYSVDEHPITLGSKYVTITGLVAPSLQGLTPPANIVYYNQNYNVTNYARVDDSGVVSIIDTNDWTNFATLTEIKLLDGTFLCTGYFYNSLGNYNIIKLNAAREIIFYDYIDIDPGFECYYTDGTTEYLTCNYGNSIKVFNPSTLNLIRTHSLNGLPDKTTNNFGQSSFMYVLGNFTQVDGVTSNRLCKINIATGTIDTAFAANIGTAVTTYYQVRTMALTDNSLILGGDFPTFNSVPVIGELYALNLNGTPNTTMISNFGTGFPPNYIEKILFTGNKIFFLSRNYVTPGSTYNSVVPLDTSIIKLNSSGVFESTVLTGGGSYKAYSMNTIAINNTLLIYLANNNYGPYNGNTTVGNYIAIDPATDNVVTAYLTNSVIPPTANVNQLVPCIKGTSISLQYYVSISNDPFVFNADGFIPYNLNNLNFNKLHFSSVSFSGFRIGGCSIQKIYGTGPANSAPFALNIENSYIGEIEGSIESLDNSTVAQFSIHPSVSFAYVGGTFKNSLINNYFYANLPSLTLEGQIYIDNCFINNGLTAIDRLNTNVFIKNSRLGSFYTGVTTSNSFFGHVENCTIEGNCFNINIFNPSTFFEFEASNVKSYRGSSTIAFNFTFTDSSAAMGGKISLVNCAIITGGISFNTVLVNAMGTGDLAIFLKNCISQDDSFNNRCVNSMGTNNIPIKYIDCKGTINCFNNERQDGGTKFSASYINCTANQGSFNSIDNSTNTPLQNNGIYNNCIVNSISGFAAKSFQTIAATPTSYLLDCMMEENSFAFLNPSSGGGAGKVISCKRLTGAGVLTTYNF